MMTGSYQDTALAVSFRAIEECGFSRCEHMQLVRNLNRPMRALWTVIGVALIAYALIYLPVLPWLGALLIALLGVAFLIGAGLGH